MPEEVKSTKSHIFHPSIAENVFSLHDEKEKVDGLGRCLDTCVELEGGAIRKFVCFLSFLKKETLTRRVEAMSPQFIVKICEEAEPSLLADFVQGLGSSLMNNVLNALHENDNEAFHNMNEDKLHKLLFVLQAFEYLHKIFPLDDALLREGDYLVNKLANDNINKSSKSKHSPFVSKAPTCTNSSASSALGVLPYSWMNSEGEYLNQMVVCPVRCMDSEGESCHSYLQSQQQLHATVYLKYSVVSYGTHAEMHIGIDNVRCRVLSYPSCSGNLARRYYVCGIKIKVEPQPSDSFPDGTPKLKLQKSTCDDARTLQSGREVSATVDFLKLSAQVGAKATQSITKNEVQWTYRQFDDGNNIGGMEWRPNSSNIGECVFSDDKCPESLIWRIKRDSTKPKTLRWRIRTRFNLKSSRHCNHIISHEVTQRFNSAI